MRFFKTPDTLLEVTGPLADISRTMVEMIDSGNHKTLVSMLLDPDNEISLEHAAALSLRNEKIFDFFDTQPTLQEEWKKRLKRRNYPDYPIQSSDGKKEFSVFSQLIGVYLWANYKNLKNTGYEHIPYLLDTACDLGIYNASLEKICLLKEELLKSGDENALTALLQKTLQFADDFWSAGCLNAGIILLDVGDHFMATHDDKSLTVVILAAIEFFHLGMQLTHHPLSESILRTHYPDQGWIEIFGDSSDLWESKDTTGGLNYLMKSIQKDFGIDNADLWLPEISESASKKAEQIMERFPLKQARQVLL